MTPAVRLLAAAVLAAAVSLFLAPSAAHADGPAATGWWTATNPGSVLGSPTPPPPPDVPADGLLIEGGADGTPTAFAAFARNRASDERTFFPPRHVHWGYVDFQ